MGDMEAGPAESAPPENCLCSTEQPWVVRQLFPHRVCPPLSKTFVVLALVHAGRCTGRFLRVKNALLESCPEAIRLMDGMFMHTNDHTRLGSKPSILGMTSVLTGVCMIRIEDRCATVSIYNFQMLLLVRLFSKFAKG